MGCGCSIARNGIEKDVKESERVKGSENFGETSKTKSIDTSVIDIGHVQIILDQDNDKEKVIGASDNNELLEKQSSRRFAVTAEKVKISEFKQLDHDFLGVGDNLQTHASKSDSNLVERLSSRRFAVSGEASKDVPSQYVKLDLNYSHYAPSIEKSESSRHECETKMDKQEKLELLNNFKGKSSEGIFSPSQSFKFLKHQKNIVDRIPSLTSQEEIFEKYNQYHKKLSIVPELPSPKQSTSLSRSNDHVKRRKEKFLAIETYANMTSCHIIEQALGAIYQPSSKHTPVRKYNLRNRTV